MFYIRAQWTDTESTDCSFVCPFVLFVGVPSQYVCSDERTLGTIWPSFGVALQMRNRDVFITIFSRLLSA